MWAVITGMFSQITGNYNSGYIYVCRFVIWNFIERHQLQISRRFIIKFVANLNKYMADYTVEPNWMVNFGGSFEKKLAHLWFALIWQILHFNCILIFTVSNTYFVTLNCALTDSWCLSITYTLQQKYKKLSPTAFVHSMFVISCKLFCYFSVADTKLWSKNCDAVMEYKFCSFYTCVAMYNYVLELCTVSFVTGTIFS